MAKGDKTTVKVEEKDNVTIEEQAASDAVRTTEKEHMENGEKVLGKTKFFNRQAENGMVVRRDVSYRTIARTENTYNPALRIPTCSQ